MAIHIYRKAFDHLFEAEETANGFHIVGPIDGRDTVEVSVKEVDGSYYVYVTLEGDFDPEEVLTATGYERALQ